MKELKFEVRSIVDHNGEYVDDYNGDIESAAWHALCIRIEKMENWFSVCMGDSGVIGKFKDGAYFAIVSDDAGVEVERTEVINGKEVNIGLLGWHKVNFTENYEEFVSFLKEQNKIQEHILMEQLNKLVN
jgi:hypothetical protein